MTDEEWFAPDGGLLLKKGQTIPPYKEGLSRTTNNDNPGLYLAIWHSLRRTNDWTRCLKFIDSTRHDTIPGLYHRQPGRDGSQGGFEAHAAVNSFDNIEGIAVVEINSGESWRCKEILKHHPVINNVTPGKINFESINTRTPSGIMGPATYFMLYLGAQQQPGWFSTLAYCARIMWTAYMYKDFTHHSSHIRGWHTNDAVERVLGRLSEGKASLVYWCLCRFHEKIKKKSGNIGKYFLDFSEGHPCRYLGVKLK